MKILFILGLLASVQADPILRFKANLNKVTCEDQTVCDDDNTCCQLDTGEWGCCPYPKAVCCSDKLHCCPTGTTCDMAESKCLNGVISFPWMEKTRSSPPGTLMCPDRQSYCPSEQFTCCMSSTGGYDCCPQPKAVCCSDDEHCCPTGYSCDTDNSACLKGDIQMFWYEKLAAEKLASLFQLKDINCPDGKSTCPPDTTCCALKDGYYGCCPMENAVCCSDKKHCCPTGYTCNTAEQSCVRDQKVLFFTELISKDVEKLENVICPDGQSYCPTGSTCCQQSSLVYGCCPVENAECCSDGLHCCPSGYKCDTGAGTCSKDALTLPWVEKTEAKVVQLESVMCPDGQSECPDGNTCCKLSNGQYGCCPLPSAVCCSDGLHCCPSGYKCDTGAGTCTKGELTLPWVEKTEAKVKLESVMCPDGQSECPDGNTCCKLSNGQYGCCPMPNAECCSDGLHCCPSGYTCDIVSGSCSQGTITVPWIAKQPATVRSVICPGGRAECDDGNTCCKLENGEYGCCPLQKAVCCSDKLHCCPEGHTCDTSEGKCNKGDLSVPWYTKTASRPIVNAIICPDGKSQCPNGNTCCQSNSGSWLCCPLPQAVCCSDGENCCPNGYRCNVSQGTCVRQSDVLTLVSLTRP